MTEKLSRRTVLLRGLRIPLAGGLALGIAACAKKEEEAALACANLDEMPDAERSTRTAMHYTERSTQPGKTCSVCAFFRAAEGGSGCGNCDIFRGPANAVGYCNSWSARS
jgi:hypothetical protein